MQSKPVSKPLYMRHDVSSKIFRVCAIDRDSYSLLLQNDDLPHTCLILFSLRRNVERSSSCRCMCTRRFYTARIIIISEILFEKKVVQVKNATKRRTSSRFVRYLDCETSVV